VPFERDKIGEFLDRGIEQFDAEHDQNRANHGDVPADAWRDEKA